MAKKPVFKFIESEWLTPNTYGSNYEKPPKKPGVYLIVNMKLNFRKCGVKVTPEILYVGSTKNLANRYAHHEKLVVFRQLFDYVGFYFREVDDYYETEKRLIRATGARFNVQWR